jgi:hypothetical protein
MYSYTINFNDDRAIDVELSTSLRLQNKVWYEGKEYRVFNIVGDTVFVK